MTEAHRTMYEEEAMSFGLSFFGDHDNFFIQKDMFSGEYVVYELAK
tara:strand:- start:261 stop:398 length:138 start_codon:yes stop_codon:yes gene_type:complete